jgi:hypothetical protein
VLTLIVALALLFVALKLLVDLLKALMSGRAERVLHRRCSARPSRPSRRGCVMTVMVQSSSITTSVMVPLVAAGIVTLEQVFPFTIGANIGTTVTALIAALSTGSLAAVTVAFSHMMFNICGTLIIYVPPPIRALPLAAARALGRLTVETALYAVAYVVVVFFVLPFLLIFVSGAVGLRASRMFFKQLFGPGTGRRWSTRRSPMSRDAQAVGGDARPLARGAARQPPVSLDLEELDDVIDEAERRVRRTILQHLAVNPKQDLVASLVLVSMVQDAERIGDFARGLVELMKMARSPRQGPFADELRAPPRGCARCSNCEKAFREGDEAEARRVIIAHQALRDDLKAYRAASPPAT